MTAAQSTAPSTPPVPHVLVAAGGAVWESGLLPLLAGPGAPVRLARRCVDIPDLVATAAAGRAGLALVSMSVSGWDADVVARLTDCRVRTVAVADGSVEADRGRRLGVGAVLTTDTASNPQSVVRALLDAAEPDLAANDVPVETLDDVLTNASDGALNGAVNGVPGGGVVAVWGPTGAPGRSTVALGVAAAAAQRRFPTLLVDADVYGGATGQMLAVLDEVSGVLAAVRTAAEGGLDSDRLAAAAREIGPNLRVLTGLPRADRWTALRPAAVRELLAVARRQHRLVVVDCGFCIEQDEELSFDTAAPRRNGATTTVLEQADLVVAVGSADPLGLTRLARARGDLRDVVPTADVRLVVNKVRNGLGWSRDEVAATLLTAIGEVPLAFLPLDQPAVDQAWLTGCTLSEAAPSSALTAAFEALAGEVAAELGLAPGAARTRHRRRGRRLVRR